MPRRLRLRFEDGSIFRDEYLRNIHNGGALVATGESLEPRQLIEVDLDLDFCSETFSFEAEVVHVPAEPGAKVAIQFLLPAQEIRDSLAPILSQLESEETAPAISEPPEPPRDTSAFASESLDAFDEDGDVDLGAISSDDLSEVLGEPTGEMDAAPDLETQPALEVNVSPPAGQAYSLESMEPILLEDEDPLQEVGDRRRAHRSPCRIPVHVDAANAQFEGRTRDISSTGLLISADANELPIGKPVRLAIQHPDTGEQVEVPGTVRRHVDTDGTVAAVGIQFEASADESEEIASFVREIKAIERKRAAGGITGVIEEIGIASLIQMLGQSSPQGTLTATSGSEEGAVAFDSGHLRYARLGSLRGTKALARMLLWKDGRFEFHAHVDSLEQEDEPLVLNAAILEAARQADEAQRGGAGFTAATSFAVDRVGLGSIGELSKTAEAVLDLAVAGLTVRRILDVIPEADVDIQAALLDLVERGVLAPAP